MNMARCTHEMISGKDLVKNNLVEKAGRGRAGTTRSGTEGAVWLAELVDLVHLTRSGEDGGDSCRKMAGAAPTSGEGGGHARATMRMVLRGTRERVRWCVRTRESSSDDWWW